jgi:hypothetical protein
MFYGLLFCERRGSRAKAVRTTLPLSCLNPIQRGDLLTLTPLTGGEKAVYDMEEKLEGGLEPWMIDVTIWQVAEVVHCQTDPGNTLTYLLLIPATRPPGIPAAG